MKFVAVAIKQVAILKDVDSSYSMINSYRILSYLSFFPTLVQYIIVFFSRHYHLTLNNLQYKRYKVLLSIRSNDV